MNRGPETSKVGQESPAEVLRTGTGSDWLLLGSILVLALVLRCIKLDISFWCDEVRTYGRASQGLLYAWSCTQVPVSYVLAALGHLVGEGEVSLRLPFVLVGLAAVGAAHALGRYAAGRVTGLVFALALAVSAYHVHYSQDARYYGTLMLLCLLYYWTLERSLTRGGFRNWILYTAVCALGMLTHETFLLLSGAAGVGALSWLWVTSSVATPRERLRRTLVLGICTFIGLSAYFLNSPESLKGLYGLAFGDPAASAEKVEKAAEVDWIDQPFRLSPKQYYTDFFAEYFAGFTDSGAEIAVHGLIVLVGVLWLFRRKPSLAAPLVSLFVLLPIPFFLLTVNHFFDARYFSVVVPVALFLWASGVAAIAEALARFMDSPRVKKVLSRGSENGILTRRGTRWLIGTVLVVLLVGPPAAQGLYGYYTKIPERDFKGIAGTIAEYLQDDDLLIYCSPPEYGFLNFDLSMNHYLSQFLRSGKGFSAERAWENDGAGAAKRVRENRDRTVWCVYEYVTFGAKLGVNFSLDTFAEPTTNLCGPGGFEKNHPIPELGQGEVIVGKGAFGGVRCLSLSNVGDNVATSAQFKLPVLPTQYSVRNGGFDVWESNAPVGWSVTGPTPKPGSPTHGETRSEKSSAAFPPQTETAELRQALEVQPSPGMEIVASCWGKADAPGQLALVLEYSAGGRQERVEGKHSGSGWEEMQCRAKLPDDVVPGSVTFSIRCNPHATATACIDDVRVTAADSILDPRLPYTLSMRAKNVNAMPYLFSVSLSGEEADGKPFSRLLSHVPDLASDWRLLTYRVEPGVHVPKGAKKLNITVELSPKSEGTLWLDNVQFEAKDHATPFVHGTRPPHDEALPQT